MPSKRPTPPTKPDVRATRKALLAYHSELQKYHEKLQQWEQLLSTRNQELMEARQDFDDLMEREGMGFEEECYCDEGTCNLHADYDDDEEDCECGPEDAKAGCPCETCFQWRKLQKEAKQPVVVGDEVQWLEKLMTLKDKRRKK